MKGYMSNVSEAGMSVAERRGRKTCLSQIGSHGEEEMETKVDMILNGGHCHLEFSTRFVLIRKNKNKT